MRFWCGAGPKQPFKLTFAPKPAGKLFLSRNARGAHVEAGQTLCQLDPGTRQISLASAQAGLAEAQARMPEAEARLPEALARLAEAEARHQSGRPCEAARASARAQTQRRAEAAGKKAGQAARSRERTLPAEHR